MSGFQIKALYFFFKTNSNQTKNQLEKSNQDYSEKNYVILLFVSCSLKSMN